MVINVISASIFTLYTIIGNLLVLWLLPHTQILFIIIACIGGISHCAITILMCVLSSKVPYVRTVTPDIPIAIAVTHEHENDDQL